MNSIAPLLLILLSAPISATDFEIIDTDPDWMGGVVSPDGGSFAVYNDLSAPQVRRWRPGEGYSGGYSPPTPSGLAISAISEGGDVMVGEAQEAIHWDNGVETYYPPFAGNNDSFILDVTDDGAEFVGVSANGVGARRSFYGTIPSGISQLPDLPGGLDRSSANAIQGDGSWIVGSGYDSVGTKAVRWTLPIVTIQELAAPPGVTLSQAMDIADDDTIMGLGYFGSGLRTFLWKNGVTTELGDCPGTGAEVRGRAINGDATIVVGMCADDPWYWTAETGVQYLVPLLIDRGVDLQGVSIRNVSSISRDGDVIAGYGEYFNSTTMTTDRAFFRITGFTSAIPQIPALPAAVFPALIVALAGIAGVSLRRKAA